MSSPAERVIAARRVAGKSHSKDFHLDRPHKSQFHPPSRRQFQPWNPRLVGLIRGDWAMWIIWYIGMMASLRAMGLAPSPLPVRIDEDRTPYGDV